MNDSVQQTLARFNAGELSAEMTLMYWLKLGHSVEMIESRLVQESESSPQLSPLLDLLRAQRAGCQRIATMIAANVDTEAPAPSVTEGIEFCRRLFDWSVEQSREASVALYSLGSPQLLSQATSEVVRWLEEQGLLSRQARIVDVGCGTGRLEVALAPRVGSILGLDVSPAMVAHARTNCSGLANVSIELSEGRGFATIPSQTLDLVLAVDSFPYLYQSGKSLLADHFAEAARVLRPGGALAVFELSYGRSRRDDQEDFNALCVAAGLDVAVAAAQPFRLWDGLAFLSYKPVANSLKSGVLD